MTHRSDLAAGVKMRTARALRHVGEWPRTPLPVARAAQRAAFAVSPHSLTCRQCGARFVQPSFGSVAHARRAYQHYIDAHEVSHV